MDTVKTKKRARPAPLFKNNPKVEIRRINGKDHFVCNHTLRLLEKRVYLPSKPRAASFANLPCAVSWVMQNAKDEATAQRLIGELAEFWEQPGGVPEAPPLDKLCNFGGDYQYAEWIGDLSLWDDHCENKGQTFEEFSSKKGKRAKSAKKKKVNRIKFAAGVALVKYQGNTEKSVKAGEGVDALKCVREINRYNKRTMESCPLVVNSCFFLEKCIVMGNAFGDVKQRNDITSQIANAELHGPAMVIAHKGFSVSIE